MTSLYAGPKPVEVEIIPEKIYEENNPSEISSSIRNVTNMWLEFLGVKRPIREELVTQIVCILRRKENTDKNKMCEASRTNLRSRRSRLGTRKPKVRPT